MRRVVEVLLEHGANPNERDTKNRTALSRLNLVKKKRSGKKIERIHDEIRAIRKLVEQKIMELETGNLQVAINNISMENETNIGMVLF